MKILFLADIVPYPPNTGIKIRTYNIIKELYENGGEIFLFAFNHAVFIHDETTKTEARKALLQFCREVHIFEIPSETSLLARYLLYLRNLFSLKPYRVQRYYSSDCVEALRDLLGREDMDLCHMDKTEFYCYRRFLGSLPVFLTNHNVESDLMRQRARIERSMARRVFAYLQYLKTRNYERYALSRADGCITCTGVDAAALREQSGASVPFLVVENGVDCRFYEPLPRKGGAGYFLIVGAQNRESTANFDATFFFWEEIWPKLKHTNMRVKIIGRNPDRRIKEFEAIDSRIEVIGYVQDEREFFCNAVALLVPLRIGGGSRLKILTAFGLGKAVISTSKGAEGIDCTDGKNILIADSAENFAAAMIRLWNDERKSEELGSTARNLALQKYDWKILGKKLHDFYIGAIANGR